jgi:flagellar protein FliS
MFGTNRTGVSAYANVGIETGVAAASPHKLIVMLFDGAAVAIRSAIVHMNAGDVAAKGLAVSKAINIIENGLRASLDKNAGGAIAASLDSLYEYMGARLLHANMKNDVKVLEEVQGLLSELRGAWDAIGTPSPATQGAGMASFEAA